MKAKIFVSSSTSIDQVSHGYSITTIPDIVCIDKEEYDDYKEIGPEAFYNRLIYDNNSSFKIKHKGFEYLDEIFNQAKNQGYTDFIFILSSLELDMIDDITKLQKEHKEDNIYVYQARSVSYLLALMVQEADKSLKNQVSIEKTFKMLDELHQINMSDFMLFKPYDDNTSPFNYAALTMKSKGVTFVYSNNNFIQVGKVGKNGDNPFKDFLRNFFEKNKDITYTPVILYSKKNSIYMTYLRDSINAALPKIKNIKEICLSPALELIVKDGLGITFLAK